MFMSLSYLYPVLFLARLVNALDGKAFLAFFPFEGKERATFQKSGFSPFLLDHRFQYCFSHHPSSKKKPPSSPPPQTHCFNPLFLVFLSLSAPLSIPTQREERERGAKVPYFTPPLSSTYSTQPTKQLHNSGSRCFDPGYERHATTIK